MNRNILISILLFLFIFTNNSFGEEFLPIEQEQRAQKLFLQIKCLVCEGQVIENSDAQIAFEMRKLIRKKIVQGFSDEEIKAYLVKNYGEEVLTKPSFNNKTFFLWFSPAIFLFLGIIFLLVRIRSNKI